MAELTLTKENFNETINNSELPVLVDFWAPWCGPCRMLGPTIEKLAEQTQGKAIVGKVNIDDEPELASSYRVMSVPTLFVFEKGEIKTKSVGVKSEKEILEMLGL